MADLKLQERILKILNGKPKKSESLSKIVQILRLPKKSVNVQLYKLKSKGTIIRVQESPPVWGLKNSENLLSLSKSEGRVTRRNSELQVYFCCSVW